MDDLFIFLFRIEDGLWTAFKMLNIAEDETEICCKDIF